MKFSRLSTPQRALATAIINFIIMIVSVITTQRLLSLPIAAVFIYSFVLLAKSSKISDMVISFFAYVFNLLILLSCALSLLEWL